MANTKPKRLPRLEKAPDLKRLPGLPGQNKPKRLPTLSAAVPDEVQTAEDAEIAAFARAVGDEALAKRVVSWQKKHYNGMSGTKLEGVIYDYLQMKHIAFDYQQAFFGGRSRAGGGLVADFIIKRGSDGMVWLPNGVYWHTQPGAKEADAAAKMKYLGAVASNGVKITSVVFMWEDKIITPVKAVREHTLSMALAGQEIPR